MTILWSFRWTHARGWCWTHERQCEAETAAQWLAQYQKDEPGVQFALSPKRPRKARNGFLGGKGL